MRLCVIQMDMRLGESAYNFAHAEALLRRAAAEGADTAMLPETWNTGFFPADHLPERSDRGGEAVKVLRTIDGTVLCRLPYTTIRKLKKMKMQ